MSQSCSAGIILACHFDRLVTSPLETILPQLSNIFSAVLERLGLSMTPAMRTGDIDGWNSFRNVEILMACEARWSIRFFAREIDRIRAVGDLAACIAAKAPATP
jgi:acyl carrier protein